MNKIELIIQNLINYQMQQNIINTVKDMEMENQKVKKIVEQ